MEDYYKSRSQELKELRRFKQRIEDIAVGFSAGVFCALFAWAIFMFMTGGA